VEQWRTQDFFRVGVTPRIFSGGSTNLVKDRGQREGDLGAAAH
jgi:hypothetical protein